MRERTVSDDVAASSASCTAGAAVICAYSLVSSQIEPIQAPAAPRVSAAATCRPQPMPPAASTVARSPTASTISGTSTMLPISPVCPPAS